MEKPTNHNRNQSGLDIITVCKNDPTGLKKTLLSCMQQDYKNINVHIVLPNENDPSLGIAEEFSKTFDNIKIHFQNGIGIYDAMNSGLEAVNNDFVWFMNAGDSFYKNNSSELAIETAIKNKVALVIGGYGIEGQGKVYCYRRREVTPLTFSLNRRWGCHQSMVFRSDVLKKIRFDEQFKIAADFKSILLLMIRHRALRLEECLSEISPGGVSDRMWRRTVEEKQMIRIELFGRYSNEAILGTLWTFAVKLKGNFRRVTR